MRKSGKPNVMNISCKDNSTMEEEMRIEANIKFPSMPFLWNPQYVNYSSNHIDELHWKEEGKYWSHNLPRIEKDGMGNWKDGKGSKTDEDQYSKRVEFMRLKEWDPADGDGNQSQNGDAKAVEEGVERLAVKEMKHWRIKARDDHQ